MWSAASDRVKAIHLQTVLFTLACTCTLVLALGSIELVGEVETDALAIVMFGHHTR